MNPLFGLLEHIESEVMRLGNRDLDYKLLHYLAARMDAGTGVVGEKQAIGRGRMALDLSEKGGAGWRAKPVEYSERDVRHALDRLVNAGVLVRESSARKLVVKFVFWADYLAQDKSVQKQVGRSMAEGWPLNSDENHKLTEQTGREVGREVGPNLTTTITTNTRETFAMHDDWLPVKGFADQAYMAGFQVKKGEAHRSLLDEAIVDVRLYWQSSKAKQRTENQHGWHQELLRTMKRLQAQQMAFPAGGSVTPISAAKKRPKLLRVPWNMDAKPLQDWGVKIAGFRKAEPGEDRDAYRAALVTHVELLNNRAERAAAGGGVG